MTPERDPKSFVISEKWAAGLGAMFLFIIYCFVLQSQTAYGKLQDLSLFAISDKLDAKSLFGSGSLMTAAVSFSD